MKKLTHSKSHFYSTFLSCFELNWFKSFIINNLQDLGIPQHHGLFYSMGLALTMEGLLSACYHLCPNKMNFQFGNLYALICNKLLTPVRFISYLIIKLFIFGKLSIANIKIKCTNNKGLCHWIVLFPISLSFSIQ